MEENNQITQPTGINIEQFGPKEIENIIRGPVNPAPTPKTTHGPLPIKEDLISKNKID